WPAEADDERRRRDRIVAVEAGIGLADELGVLADLGRGDRLGDTLVEDLAEDPRVEPERQAALAHAKRLRKSTGRYSPARSASTSAASSAISPGNSVAQRPMKLTRCASLPPT